MTRSPGRTRPLSAHSPSSPLEGSWDLVSRVITKVTTLITPIRALITLLTKSHDPPSRLFAEAVQSLPGPVGETVPH